MENVRTPSQSARAPRGYKEEERKKGLRREGEASRGYSLCYGVATPRGCENADRTEEGMKGKWAKALMCGHKVKI